MQSTHPYALVNTKRDPKELCYDQVAIKWGDMGNYVVHRKLGRGRYSHVFEGTDKRSGKRVAIKVLGPISKQKIKREYQILSCLSHPNIARLRDIVKCDHVKTTSFILELCPFVDFRELYPTLKYEQIKHYIKQLFKALDYLHSRGLMHRDVKPYNILIDPPTRTLKLIDFGLSEYYIPNKENNQNVGSLYYRAPELIFGNVHYDYRVDCWAAGLILAGMIFKTTPFIYGTNDINQVLKIIKIVGTEEVVHYIEENKLYERKGFSKDNLCFDLYKAYKSKDIIIEKKSDFDEFINANNKANCTWEAIDLVKKLLVVDYNKRFTAKQALQHPFFE